MNPTKKQIAWIKAGLFIAALIPLARLFWLGFNDDLGANPVEFVERSTGTWALVSLLVTLGMTPIRLLTGMTWQIQLRRMMGLFMYFYACLHFTTSSGSTTGFSGARSSRISSNILTCW